MRPTEEDLKLTRWSISSMVRYAPSVSESRTVFMFLLKLKPPLRTEETINHCLGSLIFQYNTDRNQEVRKLGVDFVYVALQRGMGALEYDAPTRFSRPARNVRETFLASISCNVLRARGVQISEDGLSLEPSPHLPPRRPQNTPAPNGGW
ncbi:hypothetical protein BGZ65_012932, partial [Modicella reniformis]